MQDQDGALELKHCEQLPYLWSTPLRSNAHQSGVVVRTLASLTVFSTTHCALSLDVCVQLQRTTCPYLQAFQPAELRRLGVTLSSGPHRGSLDPNHILHELLAGSPDAHTGERLISRRPFVPAARRLLYDLSQLDIRAAQ